MSQPESRVNATPFHHTPVLLAEVLQLLAPTPGERTLDLTIGGGGHAAAILERTAPDGQLVGVDRDPTALAAARERLADHGTRVQLIAARFGDVAARPPDGGAFDIVLADLGVSSPQLDTADRGFSFRHDGPLDMRMDPGRGPTARDLLAQLDATALADVIFHYGEERKSRRIARAIKDALAADRNALQTTAELAALVARVTPGGGSAADRGRIHPATRVFQALRIAVNGELDQLDALLAAVPRLLAPGGRIAIISFHSLEDRRVKTAFRELATDGVRELITRKPVTAGEAECRANPRARPAKLRVLRNAPVVRKSKWERKRDEDDDGGGAPI
ncbi:MAG: 16S rRNA (cytosine(1402)-N(4))-methyltransferase RsmH [Planctomycetota bacterium]